MKASITLHDLASLSLEDEALHSDVRCVRCASKVDYFPDNASPGNAKFVCPKPTWICGHTWRRSQVELPGAPLHHWFYVEVDMDSGMYVLEEVDDGHRRYLRTREPTITEVTKEASSRRQRHLDRLAREFVRGW